MRVRPSLAVPFLLPAFLLPALGACGGEKEITMPPLTPEPGDSQLVDSTGTTSSEESFPARLTLYKYLRAVAAGSRKACTYTSPEFQVAAFGGAGGCTSNLRAARAKLQPQDLAALRGVTVPVSEDGPDGTYIVRHEDLKWRGEAARLSPEAALLPSSYTIRRDGGRWLLYP